MKTIVITSGYFNPIHPGHIECLQLCKELGDELWVIVNNDQQIELKTGKSEIFQNQDFRMQVVQAIKYVNKVLLSIDKDMSVCKTIELTSNKIREKYGSETKIIFGKGGDKFVGNIPEVQICKLCNIEIKDGLGKKIYNSSDFRGKGELL